MQNLPEVPRNLVADVQTFKQYYMENWIPKLELINYYGFKGPRTTNSCEGFHSEIAQLFVHVVGIYNTHLIHHYAIQDQRFPVLCLLIKSWAVNSGIKAAQYGTLVVYSRVFRPIKKMQRF
uniref:Uncharacterized protein n=1 Tax=Panagrolaimus superbus TaxID=310955 RepID=A0A914ZCB2_9BILA